MKREYFIILSHQKPFQNTFKCVGFLLQMQHKRIFLYKRPEVLFFPCENAVASCDASDFCLPFESCLTHTHFQGMHPEYYKCGGLSKFLQSYIGVGWGVGDLSRLKIWNASNMNASYLIRSNLSQPTNIRGFYNPFLRTLWEKFWRKNKATA